MQILQNVNNSYIIFYTLMMLKFYELHKTIVHNIAEGLFTLVKVNLKVGFQTVDYLDFIQINLE